MRDIQLNLDVPLNADYGAYRKFLNKRVVVVGEFHVQFGGGIKNRVLRRLPGAEVVTLSQVWAEGMTDEEIQQSLQPSVEEGPRADFIWVSKP